MNTKLKILLPQLFCWQHAPITQPVLQAPGKNQALLNEGKTKDKVQRSVFIAAMCGNIELRTKLENTLAAKAAQRNIKTMKSTDYFIPTFSKGTTPSKEQIMESIRKAGAETILLITMLDQKTETRYVPGSGAYAPVPSYGWYGGFYSYYSYHYPMVYDPGYVVTDRSYYLETNLYDVATEQLLWSAQSVTVNPEGTDAFITDFSAAISQQMIKDGVLKPLKPQS